MNVGRILCKVGLHDWEVVEKTTTLEVKDLAEWRYSDTKRAVPPDTVVAGPFSGCRDLKRRVCLRCGAIDDQITPYEEKCRAKWDRAKERKRRAQRILDRVDGPGGSD